MEFALLSLIVALGWKIVDFSKYVQDRDWNSVRTQMTAWAAGVSLMFLASASDWAGDQEVNGQLLSDLNWASKVLVGASILSIASVVKDVTGQFGNSTPPAPDAAERAERPLRAE